MVSYSLLVSFRIIKRLVLFWTMCGDNVIEDKCPRYIIDKNFQS